MMIRKFHKSEEIVFLDLKPRPSWRGFQLKTTNLWWPTGGWVARLWEATNTGIYDLCLTYARNIEKHHKMHSMTVHLINHLYDKIHTNTTCFFTYKKYHSWIPMWLMTMPSLSAHALFICLFLLSPLLHEPQDDERALLLIALQNCIQASLL